MHGAESLIGEDDQAIVNDDIPICDIFHKRFVFELGFTEFGGFKRYFRLQFPGVINEPAGDAASEKDR